MNRRYEDIIALPHPISRTHPRMPRETRAAQFAPFAALTGYEEAVEETARLTEPRPELDEESLRQLNDALHALQERIEERPEAAITCFVPDEKKNGGRYVCITGRVRRIDETERVIVMEDQTVIGMEWVCGVGRG